jgi:hypothetical protein
VRKELEKLCELSHDDQEQAMKDRELLVMSQIVVQSDFERVDGSRLCCGRSERLRFVREGKFDQALEVVWAEFEKIGDVEGHLKEERDAVLASKARAETESNKCKSNSEN